LVRILRMTAASQIRPVTFAVARNVKPGLEASFEAWVRDISEAALSFPGHLGVGVVRPVAGGNNQYLVIFRFASEIDYRTWHKSAERKHWLERVKPLTLGKPIEQFTPGLEFWFTPAGSVTLRNPPRWKMLLLTLLGLLPLSLTINYLLVPMLHPIVPQLEMIILNAVIVVSFMTYVIMPVLTKVFAVWLEE
jgi:uncharacterized protein